MYYLNVLAKTRSNRLEVFRKRGAFKISQNSHQNTCNRDSFLTKLHVWDLLFFEKESPRQVFSCEFCEIFRNTFFIKTSPVAAS